MSIESGEIAWKLATSTAPITRSTRRGEIVDPFRRYGDAIAWLVWNEVCEFKKVETINPRTGAATRLVDFLVGLAKEHEFVIFGNATTYEPNSSVIRGDGLDSEQLAAWYQRRGFTIRRPQNGPIIFEFRPERISFGP